MVFTSHDWYPQFGGPKTADLGVRIKLDQFGLSEQWSMIIQAISDAQFHTNTFNKLDPIWWRFSLQRKSVKEKCQTKRGIMVPKQPTRDLWLPAPRENFTRPPPELGIRSNFFPDRKSGLHPQNRGTLYLGQQKELSAKMCFLFSSCKKLQKSSNTFLS